MGCPEEAQLNGFTRSELTEQNPFDSVNSIHRNGTGVQVFIELGWSDAIYLRKSTDAADLRGMYTKWIPRPTESSPPA